MEFIKKQEIFIGTATELFESMKSVLHIETLPNVLARKLVQNQKLLLDSGVIYEYKRTGQKKEITLMLASDGNDCNDCKKDIGENIDLSSHPSQRIFFILH